MVGPCKYQHVFGRAGRADAALPARGPPQTRKAGPHCEEQHSKRGALNVEGDARKQQGYKSAGAELPGRRSAHSGISTTMPC